MIKHSLYHRSLAVVLVICLLQSCAYYKVRTLPFDQKPTNQVINVNAINYFVVHLGDQIWQLHDPTFTNEIVSGTLKEMDPAALKYYQKAIGLKTSRVPYKDLRLIKQLHFHIRQFQKNEDLITFSTSGIAKLELMKYDARTATINIVGTAGLAYGVAILIACNCPHVYAFDGTSYQLSNTLFTGAISKNLERHDYKVMPDYHPNSEGYQLIIKNEENERQYTNLLELIVVNHSSEIEVLMDQKGKVYAIKDKIQPTTIVDDNGVDLVQKLAYNDDLGHLFDNYGETDYKHVYASFNKPDEVSNAQLVLKAKNSKWVGFVYNEFSKLFGKHHDTWVKKNLKKSQAEVMDNLKESGLPMVISIKQGDQWVDLETINLIGDVNYNSIVVPIDASLLNEAQIEVRLKSGFMFWDLDYLNIDYTPATDLRVQYLSPASAIGSGNSNDKVALANDDHLYMEHLKTGDSTHIDFTGISPANAASRTIFLHSKGYYLSQDLYEGKLQRAELVRMRREGGMSKYSQRLFNDLFLNYAFHQN